MRILLAALLVTLSLNAYSANPPKEKILDIIITSSGLISTGEETIAADKLAVYIKDRLFKSWLSPGKMYTKIRLTRNGEVADMIADPIITEIKEGQRQALIAFCVEKYNKRFEDLELKKQEQIKRKYPALFNIEYS